MATETLPDGLTSDMLESTDIAALVSGDPESAIIMADLMLKQGEQNVRRRWGQMAYIIYYVDEYELWRYHPAGFVSLSEWLMQPEIDIPQSYHSDMIAFVKAAMEFAQAGIDLFATLEDVGISKVRKLLPMMREAQRAGNLVEQVGPLLPELGATDMQGITEMLNPGGVRTTYNPQPILENHEDGTFTVIFESLDFDTLEMITKKLNLKKWLNPDKQEIPSPIIEVPRR